MGSALSAVLGSLVLRFSPRPGGVEARSSAMATEKTARGQFTAALFRDRVNNGRKIAIEILECFDRQGVTIRRGDLRRINPHRMDLYGTSE